MHYRETSLPLSGSEIILDQVLSHNNRRLATVDALGIQPERIDELDVETSQQLRLRIGDLLDDMRVHTEMRPVCADAEQGVFNAVIRGDYSLLENFVVFTMSQSRAQETYFGSLQEARLLGKHVLTPKMAELMAPTATIAEQILLDPQYSTGLITKGPLMGYLVSFYALGRIVRSECKKKGQYFSSFSGRNASIQ